MSDMQHFDDHVKSAFDEYAPEVPAGSWEKIMAERQRRKPVAAWQRFFNSKNILLVAGLLLAGGAVLGLYHHFTNTDKPISEIAKQTIVVAPGKNKPIQNPINTNTTSASIKSGDNVYENINSTTNTNPSNTQAGVVQNNNLVGKSLATNVADNKQSAIDGNLLAKKIKSVSKRKTRVKTNNADGTSSPAEGGFAGNNLSEEQIQNTIATSTNKKKVVTKKTKGKLQSVVAAASVEEQPATAAGESFLTEGTLMGKLLFNGEIISAGSLLNASADKNKITKLALTDPRCPPSEKDAAGNKQYWEIYAGPDFAVKKYNDTANSAYLEKRKSSTSFQSAFSAGARYTRVFSNGISIRAGVNYSQVNEKFSFVQGNITQVTYITNAMGDTTGSFITRGTRYKTSFNHYHTLDVPVLLGYELGNGRLHANVNAGAVINIYSWQKGDVLDTSFQPVNITTGKGSDQYQYKTNVGLGFMGAVSVYYKLNDRLHLLAEPYLRYNFSPMNNDNFSLQEKFTTIGLRLGIRMDF